MGSRSRRSAGHSQEGFETNKTLITNNEIVRRNPRSYFRWINELLALGITFSFFYFVVPEIIPNFAVGSKNYCKL